MGCCCTTGAPCITVLPSTMSLEPRPQAPRMRQLSRRTMASIRSSLSLAMRHLRKGGSAALCITMASIQGFYPNQKGRRRQKQSAAGKDQDGPKSCATKVAIGPCALVHGVDADRSLRPGHAAERPGASNGTKPWGCLATEV